MPKEIEGITALSLVDLKICYKCQNKGEVNQYFDKEIRKLAKKYGLEFWASGVDLATGGRDLCFDTGEKETLF